MRKSEINLEISAYIWLINIIHNVAVISARFLVYLYPAGHLKPCFLQFTQVTKQCLHHFGSNALLNPYINVISALNTKHFQKITVQIAFGCVSLCASIHSAFELVDIYICVCCFCCCCCFVVVGC